MEPHVALNITSALVANSLTVFRPFFQGYLVNWDVQRKVWDHLFGKEMFKVWAAFILFSVTS